LTLDVQTSPVYPLLPREPVPVYEHDALASTNADGWCAFKVWLLHSLR